MARPDIASSVQNALGIPPGTKWFSPYPFAGMNRYDGATSIQDSEFLWVENFLRLGNGNLRTAWDVGTPIFTAGGSTIISFDFYTIGTTYYGIMFLSNGSAVQINMATGATTTVGPAATFYVPGGVAPAVASWGTQYLLISNQNTRNDYWVWNGTTLFTAGSVEPDSAIITNSGSNYTTAPTVTPFGGSGTGLAITATVNAGSVVNLRITNAGTGYQVGDQVQLAFSGGGSDTGAILTAGVNAGGVSAVNVNVAGSGYTSATVAFTGGGGSGAAGTVLLGSGVTSIAVTAGGTGYTSAPAITFTGGAGSGAAAIANITGGVVTSITVTSPGTGYTSAPTVVFTGGVGTGATAMASFQNGIVTGILMTAAGSGYTSAPTVAISGTGTGASGFAVLNPGGITSVNVVNGGSGYTSAPGVSFVGGGGTGATGIVQLTGTSIASINVVAGGVGYQVAPTVTIVGNTTGGSGATAVAVLQQGQVVAVNVTNGGSGYTGNVEVAFTPANYLSTDAKKPQDPGTGAAARAVFAPTSIASVIISSQGQGYTSSPAVVLNTGSNNAAAGVVSLMPYGVSGAALTTYQQRVWILNPAPPTYGTLPPGGNFAVSAPGSFTNFATSNGAVQFTNSDGFLQTQYTAVRQSNGYLYMFGDGSVSIISSVSTGGNPATTTFNYQNVDPQTGALYIDSLQDFGKTILFANNVGVYGLYGGTAAKASEKINELFSNANFNPAAGGLLPSSAVVTLFGIKHYLLLMKVFDPDVAGYRTVMATWNEKEWVLTSQSVNLTYINAQKVGSKLFAWGTDGTKLYPLFKLPSTNLTKKLYTKQYGGAQNCFIVKSLMYHHIQAQDQDGSGIACTVDIQASGVSLQPIDPGLDTDLNMTIANPWVVTPTFPAPYPYWPIFGTKAEPGIPFVSVSARLTTKSPDFILGNWMLSYIDDTAHM